MNPDLHLWTVKYWMNRPGQNFNAFTIWASPKFVEAAKKAMAAMDEQTAQNHARAIVRESGAVDINAKLGTVPTLVQLRHRYGLLKGDRVLYRQVSSTRLDGGTLKGFLLKESWQPGMVDEDYPYPHNPRNLLRLSKF